MQLENVELYPGELKSGVFLDSSITQKITSECKTIAILSVSDMHSA